MAHLQIVQNLKLINGNDNVKPALVCSNNFPVDPLIDWCQLRDLITLTCSYTAQKDTLRCFNGLYNLCGATPSVLRPPIRGGRTPPEQLVAVCCVRSAASSLLPAAAALTKADRFPLVFRVSIRSSTIWNRLQWGGTIDTEFTSAAPWGSSFNLPEGGSLELPVIQVCQVLLEPVKRSWLTLTRYQTNKLWNKAHLYSVKVCFLYELLPFN